MPIMLVTFKCVWNSSVPYHTDNKNITHMCLFRMYKNHTTPNKNTLFRVLPCVYHIATSVEEPHSVVPQGKTYDILYCRCHKATCMEHFCASHTLDNVLSPLSKTFQGKFYDLQQGWSSAPIVQLDVSLLLHLGLAII